MTQDSTINRMALVKEWRDASTEADNWMAVAIQQQANGADVDPFVIEMIGRATLAAKIASAKIKDMQTSRASHCRNN